METVEKKWGREVIFANNEMYCGKLLIHDKAGSKGSMHFHMKKHETFYVQSGMFKIHWIETKDASKHNIILKEGDTWVNEPGRPHQIEALEDNSVLIEASTTHYDSDSYRVIPGDGQ
jgi:mannose-6-phosphate isomerase-like protein (cupin superfamily)